MYVRVSEFRPFRVPYNVGRALCPSTVSEPRGNNSIVFMDFYLKAEDVIWP